MHTVLPFYCDMDSHGGPWEPENYPDTGGGTPKGAKASALYYSLIETAKANGLDPFDYLRTMLKQLPYATTVEETEALLPWNIKKECVEKQVR